MKPEEAVDIVAMIAANWPSNNWSVASLEAYARGIEGWDAAAATNAVLRAVQDCEFYPKVAVLREFYRIEKRLSEPDLPIERALADTPSRLMPAWCKGWVVSRVRHNDMRVWPEQREHLDGEPMPSDVCNGYISEAEGLPIEALFKTMVGEIG